MRYIINDNSTYCNNSAIPELICSVASLVSARYPVRLSDYYAGLIKRPGDAIWKQCMPDVRELGDLIQAPDPLAELALSPVPGLIHRYPDRVILLVSNRCPVYCRFCMRKRHVGSGDAPMKKHELESALAYIAAHPQIKDVILSGGDPLMLDDESLVRILSGVRAIPHVALIRIGTRVPVTLPGRITIELCSLLKQLHPLYINTHFNHPDEITAASRAACSLLSDAGIPLGNQTVLLKGVNDTVETMRELMTGLLAIRVKPYYLHQMDLVQGTAHFRTSVRTGIEIMRGLRGHVSGLAVPHYVIDLPGGKGKVAILPDDVKIDGTMLTLRTYTGEVVQYQDITTPPE
ncbi:MAG: KamA family radical SAM protein [Desulfuromonadaceae bacterium]|nr:KamA family radical SAM protein [Desulfuromonadaceae bacterium]MDD5105813.1 KamA family radical SAM protein [Desulfuromonadaceae bacterium]